MNVAPVAPTPVPARAADAPSAVATAFGDLVGVAPVVPGAQAGAVPVVASAATMPPAQPVAIKAPAADVLPAPLPPRDAAPTAQPAPIVATAEPDMPATAAPATPEPTTPPPAAPMPATMADMIATPMATLPPVVVASAPTPKLAANAPESDNDKVPATMSKPKSAKAAPSVADAQPQPVQLAATPVVTPPATGIPNAVAGTAHGKDEDSADAIGGSASSASPQAGPRDALAAGAPLPAHVAPDNLPPLLASQTPGAAIAPPTGQTPSYAPIERPTPVVTAEPGRIGRDIGVEIARHVSAGRDEVMIRLSPAEMGRIDVRLSFDSKGALHAAVSADNPQALDMLRRDAGDLGRSLADAGIRTDGFSFDSRGNSAGQFAQQQPQGGQSQPRHPATPFEADAGDAAPASPYRQLRTSGRVDLMA